MAAQQGTQDVEAASAPLTSNRQDTEPGQVKPEETEPLGERDVNPKQRGCTDVICCLLFITALVALAILHISCFQQEHPFKILRPLDHAGNSCGIGKMADFPLVYYPAKNMITGGPLVADAYYGNPLNRWSVCTSECPTAFSRKDRPFKCNEPARVPSSDSSSGASNGTSGVNGTASGSSDATIASSSMTSPSISSPEWSMQTAGAEENPLGDGFPQKTQMTYGSSLSESSSSYEGTPTCTWYTESPATPILGKYCVAGLATTDEDPTGLVCSSAQEAIANVHNEAKQAINDLGNMTANDLQFLKTRVPAHHLWVIKAIEKSIEQDSLKYTDALGKVAQQAKEQHIVKVCANAIEKQESTLVSFVTDVMNAATVLMLSAMMCVFFGIVYLFLVCKFVKVVVWGSLFVAIVGFSVTGYIFWTQGIQVKDTGLLEEGQEEMALAVICWIFAGILLIVLLLCRRSLQLAIAISETTSSFLINNLGMLCLPQFIAFFELCWVAYWLIGLTAILSTAKVNPAENLTEEIARFQIDGVIVCKLLFHCYVGMWVHFFFEGLSAVTSSIAVTEWYFAPKVNGKKKHQRWSVISAFMKALLYHLGSIAFGSGILPPVVTLRLIIAAVRMCAQKLGEKNFLFKWLCCCLGCCLRCATGCLNFISTNSYIMVGVLGKNFCKSAWETWTVMARNPRRFFIFKGVMWTIDVACRFFLIGVTLAFGSLFLDREVSPSVKSVWPPLIAIALIGYFIAGLFANVYTTSGSALFFCFVADEEIARSSGRDAGMYAPKGLQSMLDAEEKQGKTKDEKE